MVIGIYDQPPKRLSSSLTTPWGESRTNVPMSAGTISSHQTFTSNRNSRGRFACNDGGGPNGICHLVGQYLRFSLEGICLRIDRAEPALQPCCQVLVNLDGGLRTVRITTRPNDSANSRTLEGSGTAAAPSMMPSWKKSACAPLPHI